jgi:hypothetical protein
MQGLYPLKNQTCHLLHQGSHRHPGGKYPFFNLPHLVSSNNKLLNPITALVSHTHRCRKPSIILKPQATNPEDENAVGASHILQLPPMRMFCRKPDKADKRWERESLQLSSFSENS